MALLRRFVHIHHRISTPSRPHAPHPVPSNRPPPRAPPLHPHPHSPPPPSRSGILGLCTFIACISALGFISEFVFTIADIHGASMYPFFNADYHERTAQDKVWVNLMRPTEGLERGMIVAFWSPSNPERMGVKRIIALEGDDVVTRRPYPVAREDVPVGHVWVEGDQRDPDKAYDSNWLGPISKNLIIGKVEAVVWPWRKAGRIRWQDYSPNPRVSVGAHEVEQYKFFG